MINDKIKTEIEKNLVDGKKIQIEYNKKENNVKLLEIKVKKIQLD